MKGGLGCTQLTVTEATCQGRALGQPGGWNLDMGTSVTMGLGWGEHFFCSLKPEL